MKRHVYWLVPASLALLALLFWSSAGKPAREPRPEPFPIAADVARTARQESAGRQAPGQEPSPAPARALAPGPDAEPQQVAREPQKVTILADVVSGEGAGQVFVGPFSLDLADRPIFRDPFTGQPFVNEAGKRVTCEDLVALEDQVIFDCILRKDVKYKTLTAATEVPPGQGLGLQGGIQSVGDLVHATAWINFAGVADVPGAEPGDSVELEGFRVQQSLRPGGCVDFPPPGAEQRQPVLADAICSTLEEKDDVTLFFKTFRRLQLVVPAELVSP